MHLQIHRSLAGDLAELSLDLADDHFDLQDGLSALWRDYRLAVASALGFALTVQTDIHPSIVITQAVDIIDPAEVRSTLNAAMGRLERVHADWSITYYAEEAGALHPFSADLADATGIPLAWHSLDHHHPDAPLHPGITGLQAFSIINRAIGVLITQGRTPREARAQFEPGQTTANLSRATELVAAAGPAAAPG